MAVGGGAEREVSPGRGREGGRVGRKERAKEEREGGRRGGRKGRREGERKVRGKEGIEPTPWV